MQHVYENYCSTQALASKSIQKELASQRRQFRHFFYPLLPKNRDARIVDLGCGYGALVKVLEEWEYTKVSGVDISEDQIRTAHDVLGLTSVEKGDALELLEQNDEMYDVIFAIDLIEHLPLTPQIDLLNAVRSRLSPEGILILQVPNGLCPLSPNFHGDITHKRAYSPQSISQALRIAGFKCIEVKAVPPVFAGIGRSARALLWYSFLWPLILTYCLVAFGTTHGGIYTPNLIASAKRD